MTTGHKVPFHHLHWIISMASWLPPPSSFSHSQPSGQQDPVSRVRCHLGSKPSSDLSLNAGAHKCCMSSAQLRSVIPDSPSHSATLGSLLCQYARCARFTLVSSHITLYSLFIQLIHSQCAFLGRPILNHSTAPLPLPSYFTFSGST